VRSRVVHVVIALAMTFASAAASPPRAAESDAQAASPPETVRVEGVAPPAPFDFTGSMSIIRAEDFASRLTTVSELLAQSVGLHVRAYGGLGSFATVSIRGSTAEQVNVYVDGVLLNPAVGGGVNLADFSLSSIESIEIYRGFTPASLGGSAIGGAINIRTKEPSPGRAAASGSMALGSYGTVETSGLVSWAARPGAAGTGRPGADGLVSMSLTRSDGDFRFYDDNGTTRTAADDGFETRENNRFWTGEILGRAGMAMDAGGRVELQTTFTRRRQGVPGIGAFQSVAARSEMTRALVKAALADVALTGTLDAAVDASYTRTWQRFLDRSGGTTGGTAADSRNVLDAAGTSVQLRWHPDTESGVESYFSMLLSGRRETAARTDWNNPEPDRGGATRLAWSVALEDEIHMAGGRVLVTPTARWEGSDDRIERAMSSAPASGGAGGDRRAGWLTGRLGTAWRPRATLGFRAAAGRYHRLPSFLEMFGDEGAIRGNDRLEPESGWNYDLGATWDPDRNRLPRGLDGARTEISLFLNEADDLIQFVQVAQNRITAQNTGRARVRGAELSTSLTLLGCLTGGLGYTWQVATDRSDTFRRDSDLPGRPRHQLSATASLARPWGRPFYEFTYVGPNYFDAAASAVAGSGVGRDLIRLPGRYLHNAGFTRGLGARFEATLEVDNIFNVKTVDVVRYPLPGRVVEAKLRFKVP